jgi:hypothetical protein
MKTLLAEDMAATFFRDMFGFWMESEINSEFKAVWAPTFTNTDDPNAEIDYMLDVLRDSENFYVAPQMVRLANEVAPAMPDEDLLPHDLPSNVGFMWLAEPFRQIDIRRKTMSVDCLMWHVASGKVRIWHFTHKNNASDWVNQWAKMHYRQEFLNRLPVLSINHVFEMDLHHKLPRGISFETPLPFDAQVKWTTEDNDDGSYTMLMSSDQPIDDLAMGKDPEIVRSPMAAFIVCLWRLCQQSIASRLVDEPSRPARRRMTRAHVPVKPITVINLRRYADVARSDGETHVEWQHHWVVRSHWRNQPYRELDENGEKVTVHRQILIAPYLKGDLDKPLLHRDKVNALIR